MSDLRNLAEAAIRSLSVVRRFEVYQRSLDSPVVRELGRRMTEAKRDWLRRQDFIWMLISIVEHPAPYTGHRGDEPIPLTAVLDAPAIADRVERLVKLFVSIPRAYRFYFALPSFSEIGSESIRLTADVSLVKTVVDNTASMIRPTHLAAHGPSVSPNQVYLEVAAAGYFSGYSESSASDNAYSTVKQLLGIATVLDLVIELPVWLSSEARTNAISLDLESDETHSFHMPAPMLRTLGRVFLKESSISPERRRTN